MNIRELVHYFKTHRNVHTKGARQLATLTHSDVDTVVHARRLFRSMQRQKKDDLPKILIFDIETAPIRAYVWQMWKAKVTLDQRISDWFILCWSAKWLYSTEVMGDCITSEEVAIEDDERIVHSLWKLFDEADIIVAHNGLGFDVPRMNVRFLKYGLNPPSPYRVVDTLQVSKKVFSFSSNKLDALAIHLGFNRKLDTDFELWSRCMKGELEALDYMFEYNKYDVQLLEEVYVKLLPWIKNYPNINNYTNSEETVCCACGKNHLVLIPGKYYYTQISKYPIYRCSDCGAISRGRRSLNSTKTTTTPLYP